MIGSYMKWLCTSILSVVVASAALCGSPAEAKTPKRVKTPVVTVSPQEVMDHGRKIDFHDPKLLAAIAYVESSYRPSAKLVHRKVGYYGLMQMSYGTAKMVGYRGTREGLMNWRTNATYAAKYLEVQKAKHKEIHRVIASYNAGTVYMCTRTCKKGNFTNQGYVNNVMRQYNKLTDHNAPVKKKEESSNVAEAKEETKELASSIPYPDRLVERYGLGR